MILTPTGRIRFKTAPRSRLYTTAALAGATVARPYYPVNDVFSRTRRFATYPHITEVDYFDAVKGPRYGKTAVCSCCHHSGRSLDRRMREHHACSGNTEWWYHGRGRRKPAHGRSARLGRNDQRWRGRGLGKRRRACYGRHGKDRWTAGYWRNDQRGRDRGLDKRRRTSHGWHNGDRRRCDQLWRATGIGRHLRQRRKYDGWERRRYWTGWRGVIGWNFRICPPGGRCRCLVGASHDPARHL